MDQLLVFNPTFAYSCNFDFNGKVMEGFLVNLQRMAPDKEARKTINREMVMHRDANRLFGFDVAIQERNISMASKPLKFKILITCFI
jgi:hypothetical protein